VLIVRTIPGKLFDCVESCLNEIAGIDYSETWPDFTPKSLLRIRWNPMPDLGGKEGGVFVIASSEGIILAQAYFGRIPKDKIWKYWRLATEKSYRLSIHPEHVSSWQSRDGETKWGGAIRVEEYILSFSGLPELWDEALMLLTARVSSHMKSEIAESVASISSNPYWGQLKQIYCL
jgi:hypothetical protein